MLVLLVEDDEDYAEIIAQTVRRDGHDVVIAPSTSSAQRFASQREPGMAILDVVLPDGTGMDVCRDLRTRWPGLPVLFLSSLDRSADVVAGLESGGDDYVTKPFSLDEIVARIKAILRRTMHDDEEAIIRAGDLTMDQDTHEVTIGTEQVELSPTEFKLLRYLMLNPNRVLSKAQILDHVWEYDFNGDAGIVESYISYLRRKLDQYSEEPVIQTKRGFGYMLKASKV